MKQYKQELCISLITRCFTKRLQSRPLNLVATLEHFTGDGTVVTFICYYDNIFNFHSVLLKEKEIYNQT